MAGDAQTDFYRILRGTSEKADYGLSESSGFASKISVPINSNHEAVNLFKTLKEGRRSEETKRGDKDLVRITERKTSPKKSSRKRNNRRRSQISESTSCTSCGKPIRKPRNGCSVLCVCGKVNT